MAPMTMLQTATVLLLLTAVGGVVMAVVRLAQEANPPAWLTMAHGLLAAAGLTLLVYSAVNAGLPGRAGAGLVILLAAAAGGVIMNLFFQLAGKLLPKRLLYLHIALATVGAALVTWGAWGG